MKYLKVLYVQVLIAIFIGILLGHFYPDLAVKMQPLGKGFINLIKMIIAPLIFSTVVTGIAGMNDIKAVGKTGGMALIYLALPGFPWVADLLMSFPEGTNEGYGPIFSDSRADRALVC